MNKQLARDIFVHAIANSTGLGSVTKEQRVELLKEAAYICCEAATVFEEALNSKYQQK
jgi:hypothetical protein